MTNLPYDVARCEGVGYIDDTWREDCAVCLRRLCNKDVNPHGQFWMQPPADAASECEYLITRDDVA